jgi:hypothetical protein
MAWDGAKQAGFVLAAVLAGDRELLSVASALPAGLLPVLQARCRGLVPLAPHQGARCDPASSEGRVQALRELAAEVRPPLTQADALPPRGRALVAELLPRELGRSYVRAASPARPGFEPEPELIRWLARLAQHESCWRAHDAPRGGPA